jgi:enediyne biosynthesis protein E4
MNWFGAIQDEPGWLFHKTMGLKEVILIFALALLVSCQRDGDQLFRLVPASKSGLNFVNTVEEKDTINILTVQYMYHGGGVAIGDFNNDTLQDIFFTGNMVPNRLFLNRGNLKFEDVSDQAGIGAKGKWNTGVALSDVNEDGRLDIYVCASINDDPVKRENSLFIHQGVNAQGIPVFTDEAKKYGIADQGYSQNAAFLDYDKDGDQDLYVLTNLESDKIPSVYRPKITDGSALNNDRLYRNNGNGSFTDVTREAGILIEGYGLGLGIADINGDGWQDIYVGNDYVSNDILYINNQDGTFSNEIRKRINHQSLFSMGVDIADINNDLFNDIITLDMLPEVNQRRKTISGGGATYMTYVNNIEYDYEFQYMRNMLHVNQGDGTFSEVGQMAGVHQTEWSWSPLFIDVDNDGLRDLLITNGFPKDVTDRDYVMFKREVGAFQHHRSLIDSIPILKVSNYVFKNGGNLNFADMTDQWGMNRPSFSMGAAFADLDNDGDIDYVVNNINDPAFLYENTLYNSESRAKANYLRVGFHSDDVLTSAQGAKIILYYDSGKTQFHEHSTYRGYLSTVEDIVHFGLGESSVVDSMIIEWPDFKIQLLYNTTCNQVLTVNHSDASTFHKKPLTKKSPPIFLEASSKYNLKFKHVERDKVDFYKQRTLPHKFSQAGPGMAVGDINGDGLEDVIIGGSSLHDEHIFVQSHSGSFVSHALTKPGDRRSEDEGLLLFDADNDQDLDLYVVSGSYEFEPGDAHYQDRLYLNDGKGNFQHKPDLLPPTLESGSCVRAADFDADGDLDLFVGSRVITGAYPMSPKSYLLRNTGGKFDDATDDVCPDLRSGGMISDALWTDYDNDGKYDLMVVGEFMPITIYKNDGNRLGKVNNTNLEKYAGWWNSIAAGDFDGDGDTDYVSGNLGLNNFYRASDVTPLRIYAKDIDLNGSIDPILTCYFKSSEGRMLEYPIHFWDDLNAQSPKFRNQFSSYKQYGAATAEDLLRPHEPNSGMSIFNVNHTQSSYLENSGDGAFTLHPLPREAQVAPINGLLPYDINKDGHLDILAVGNEYGNEVFTGRYDACKGLALLGDGHGNFSSRSTIETGFRVAGDAKALVKLHAVNGRQLILASQNMDSLKVYEVATAENKQRIFRAGRLDCSVEFVFDNGKEQKVELHYGSGYLSQSSRSVVIPENVREIVVHTYTGKRRRIGDDQIALLKTSDKVNSRDLNVVRVDGAK